MSTVILTYDPEKWLYYHEENTRYVLGIKGKKPLICFGTNPSTAKPDRLDNTLRSVERISRNNGFDGWVMLNVYPQRSTDPNGMHIEINKEIHQKNLGHINDLLSAYPDSIIWAAWGTVIEKRMFLMNCFKDIYLTTLQHRCNWVSFGKPSKKGHPHHPLYLNGTTKPDRFDIKMYMERYVM